MFVLHYLANYTLAFVNYGNKCFQGPTCTEFYIFSHPTFLLTSMCTCKTMVLATVQNEVDYKFKCGDKFYCAWGFRPLIHMHDFIPSTYFFGQMINVALFSHSY